MPWHDPFWAALKREPDVVETLVSPIRSLEILAGLLAPIESGTGGIVSVRSTSGLDRSSPDAALRRGVFALGRPA